MTETANIFPPGRYGRRRDPRRRRPWLPVVLLVLAVAASAAIAIRLYSRFGDPDYRAALKSFRVSDRSVTVVFEVTKPAGEPAVCGVRARNYDGREVGRELVRVPAGSRGQRRVTVTHTLATTERAFAVDVARCGAPGTN